MEPMQAFLVQAAAAAIVGGCSGAVNDQSDPIRGALLGALTASTANGALIVCANALGHASNECARVSMPALAAGAAAAVATSNRSDSERHIAIIASASVASIPFVLMEAYTCFNPPHATSWPAQTRG
jgi:hypothetical protein